MSNSNDNGRDWRARYLQVLREQEQQQALLTLLARATQRITTAAQGQDRELDARLQGLQVRLREKSTTLNQLQGAIEALETQLKHSSSDKQKAQKAFGSHLQRLADLLAQRADDDTRNALKQLAKGAKHSAAYTSQWSEALAQLEQLAKKTGAGSQPGGWRRWFNRQSPSADAADQPDTSIPASPSAEPSGLQTPIESPPTPSATTVLEAAVLDQRPLAMPAGALVDSPEVTPAAQESDPPFSRLSQAICSVLSELLRQIEPADSAKADYEAAKAQIARGLNWYELVPTLEHLSLAVLSAIDRDQREFQQYLSTVDARLAQAQDALSLARAVSDATESADQDLQASVRANVDGLQREMAEAKELSSLKHQISRRLDGIVQAMDQFQRAGQAQRATLSDQLGSLLERVREMEAGSRQAQEKLEQQRQLALRDMLTQLPNRHAYEQRLAEETERWRRYGRPLSLAVCDVDHFKRINDTYGHQAGDKVLRVIARTLRQRLRQTDFIARYGGEEFVVLMPETDPEAALKVMDAVREAVAQCPFHFREQRVGITLSAGICGFSGQANADQVFQQADQALYAAKGAGRNRCIVAET